MNKKAFLGLVFSIGFLSSCATTFLKYDKPEQLKQIEEFDEKVKIEDAASQEGTSSGTGPTMQTQEKETSGVVADVSGSVAPVGGPQKKVSKKGNKKEIEKDLATDIQNELKAEKTKKKLKTEKPVKAEKPASVADSVQGGLDKPQVKSEPIALRREPELEDAEGFSGRRPLVDPYRVGEEIVHDVNYFKVSAGELRFKVAPFVKVNEKKAYAFKLAIKTSPLFSSFYSVDDSVDIFMDFESLVPNVFQLHVTESGQLREAKMLFNDKDNTATFWEKKVTKKDGVEEKKQNWEILPFSQNVYSSIFYMRFFKWEVGKEYAYRVANDKENLVFSGKALRKEILETKLGPMKSIVIEPHIVLKGKFTPIGENLIWLSDDEHRYILRIEAKIKIGTLVSEVTQIKKQ